MILHDNKEESRLIKVVTHIIISFLSISNNIPLCYYTTFTSWRTFRFYVFLIMVNKVALWLLDKFLHEQVF